MPSNMTRVEFALYCAAVSMAGRTKSNYLSSDDVIDMAEDLINWLDEQD